MYKAIQNCVPKNCNLLCDCASIQQTFFMIEILDIYLYLFTEMYHAIYTDHTVHTDTITAVFFLTLYFNKYSKEKIITSLLYIFSTGLKKYSL